MPPRIESGDFVGVRPIDAIKLVLLSAHRPNGETGSYEFRFTPGHFYRLICKIAYGLAIWNHSIDYFEPILVDYIIQGNGDHTQFIGTAPCGKVGDKLHSWEYFEIRYPTETYLGVKLQLFSQYVDFAYHVVVGKLKSNA